MIAYDKATLEQVVKTNRAFLRSGKGEYLVLSNGLALPQNDGDRGYAEDAKVYAEMRLIELERLETPESEIQVCHLLARSSVEPLSVVQIGMTVVTLASSDVDPCFTVLYVTIPALAFRTNAINPSHRAALTQTRLNLGLKNETLN
jgi:hypothetical protein